MIHRFLLFTLLLAGCSSHKVSREELLKLSIFHKQIPVADEKAAKKFILDQKFYIELLYEGIKKSTSLPCRRSPKTGNLEEQENGLLLIAESDIDNTGKTTGCFMGSVFVWDIYFYCKGESHLTNMKISKDHLFEMKEFSLCK